MARNRRTSFSLAFFLGLFIFSAPLNCHAQDAAIQLEEIAANAQNDGSFQVAIGKWEELIKDHPQYSRIGRAEFNCGKCYLETQDFQQAIAHFKQATQKLGDGAKVMLPESYLYLGYSQYELGRQIQDAEKANQLLATASQTFTKLQKDFEDFEHNDQVCYFQGLAFEALDRLDKAAESYEAMFAFKEDTAFKLDGLFFLANVYERLGQYDKAMKRYREYLEVGKDDRSYNEVLFRTASTLAQMAPKVDPAQFKENLTEAKQIFTQVAAIEEFPFRDDAQYQLAVCSHRLGDLEEAASQYRVLADRSGSEKAAVWAGRNFLSIGNVSEAEKYLKKVADQGGKRATEAAHFLAMAKLNSEKPGEAFDLADQWIEKSEVTEPFIAELMLDRADAAFAMADRRADSPDLYLELYYAFPNHLLSAAALYNAAFSYVETNEFDKAEKLCEEFESKFENDSYMPDLLEVHADVHLLKDEMPESQKIFETLVSNYGDHPKLNTWKMRVGFIMHRQKLHDKTIEWLTPMIDDFDTESEKAEAWHWIGSSYLAQQKFEQAETALTRSLNTDQNWRFAPQTLLSLSQAQQSLNKSEEAAATIATMKDRFPEAKQGIEADFRAAETAYKAKKFDEAIRLYKTVIAGSSESEFTPYSQFGIAWSCLEKSDFAQADVEFTKFLADHPKSELATQALLGRGMSRRQNDDPQGALEDLKSFISDNPTDGQIIEARYEVGLSLAKLEQTADAITTFEELIDDAPTHRLADHFHYELAWLYANDQQSEKGHEQFVVLTEEFPDSELTPMAHFKVGEKAYAEQSFEEAVDSYRLCLNSGGEAELREKAAYRLGWCFYKQKKYEQAQQNFALQVQQFENGRYSADALFMIGESHFNLDQMKEAFDAYVKVDDSIADGGKIVEKNIWLTHLHGAVSGNQIQRHEESLNFANRLIESEATEGLKLEGWFEKGRAQMRLRQNEEARASFAKVTTDRVGELGAKAYCMIGDLHFVDKNFDEAISTYTNVFYGYGGSQKNELVDPWQGYAIYHAARCSYVQIQQAKLDGDTELVTKLASDAAKLYEKLLADYPDDQFASEAQAELTIVQQLK